MADFHDSRVQWSQESKSVLRAQYGIIITNYNIIPISHLEARWCRSSLSPPKRFPTESIFVRVGTQKMLHGGRRQPPRRVLATPAPIDFFSTRNILCVQYITLGTYVDYVPARRRRVFLGGNNLIKTKYCERILLRTGCTRAVRWSPDRDNRMFAASKTPPNTPSGRT